MKVGHLCPGYTKARHGLPDKIVPDRIVPDRVRRINCWFYLASWTKSLLVGQIMLNRRCVSCCKRNEILVLSGTIWPISFKFPSNFWSSKPNRTSIFFRLALSGAILYSCLGLGVASPWAGKNGNEYLKGLDGFVEYVSAGRYNYQLLYFILVSCLFTGRQSVWWCLVFTQA